MSRFILRKDLIECGNILSDMTSHLLKPQEYLYYLKLINGSTLQSIADEEGVSRERIRQILMRVRCKLFKTLRKVTIAVGMIGTGVNVMIEKDISSIKVTSELPPVNLTHSKNKGIIRV